MKVQKRNNDIVDYDLEKISCAIAGPFEERGEEFDDVKLLISVDKTVNNFGKDTISVEEIQDIVEDELIKFGYIEEAKSYIKYRYEHSKERERQKAFENLIDEKLKASNVQNQNANVDEKSFGGRMGEANDALMKKIALEKYVSPKTRKNHEENRIYIHDLSSLPVGMHNCLTIPFDKLLAEGFNTRQTDVRPANSVNTAFQLVAVIFQLQSLMQFGGVSASHIDWTMVPYVRKSFYKHYLDGLKYCGEDIGYLWSNDMPIDDSRYKVNSKAYQYAMDKTIQEVHQAVEGMQHNLNTLQSRSGNQLKNKMAG